MRLHRLEAEGFGPFRDRQTVDFDAFADDGIFLIAGRTGAGKSSILDAVCFALYGGVPRYESGEKRLRSDHCAPDDPSEVVVEFSTTAGRFRVVRSPEYLRPAKRGGGMTKQASSVRLDRRDGDDWRTIAAKEREVGHELDEILQLSREQFLQVILLAQNRFARFLLADSRERQSLLRRLFATERFEKVQSRFEERRRESENRLGARLAVVAARVEEAEGVVAAEGLSAEHTTAEEEAEPEAAASADPASLTTDERLELLRRALARAQYRAERRDAERVEAERASDAAGAALAERREQRTSQQDRDRAREAMAALDAAEPRIVHAREELSRAQAAESLRAVIGAADRADAERADAEQRREAARVAWETTGLDAVASDAAALRDWVAARTRERGVWEEAAILEREAADRARDLDVARARVADAEAAVAAGEDERAALPERIAECMADRDRARREADRLDALTADRDRARARLSAARDVARLSREIASAERAVVDAGDAHTRAQSALNELRRRRLDGFAGELAAALAEGAPCPVCGSVSHPTPAEHSDPVSADDIDAAEAVRDDAATAEREASERAAAVRAELAAARTRADGRDVDAAEQELAALDDALTAASAEAERVAALEQTLADLQDRAARLDEERTAAAAAVSTAREALVVQEQRDADAAERIERARDGYDTVAARIAALAEQIDRAQELADAIAEHTRTTDAAARARVEQDHALAASDFSDPAAVRDALRTDEERRTLQERITAHAAQREAERSRLLELEMRALPEEPIDLSAAERAAEEARAAWTRAVDAASRAAATVERLSALIDAAADEHAAVADLAAEHEVLQGLADTIAGRGANTHRMALETFVLAAELEEIVDAANRRMADMSTGRYRLQHSDALAARGAASGLGIVVYDAFTGQTRPAQSLSGGETFLSSLALALGLAEVVTARAGGIRLDTLFIDEGFGSLDADTLDVAMRTLDELRAGGRTVGIISHVEAMQEQIPAQVRVEQTEAGPSRIV